MRFTVVFFLSLVFWGQTGSPEYFLPSHRVSGVGVDRDNLSAAVLEARTDLMIQSQTFAIMREDQALAGARRITDPKLQSIFLAAAQSSGLPVTMIEAIAYLESFGSPLAESGAAPTGIMQISLATAHDMGLKVSRITRYKVTH
jgi:soluble lytic murein transglycosylase-like protein